MLTAVLRPSGGVAVDSLRCKRNAGHGDSYGDALMSQVGSVPAPILHPLFTISVEVIQVESPSTRLPHGDPNHSISIHILVPLSTKTTGHEHIYTSAQSERRAGSQGVFAIHSSDIKVYTGCCSGTAAKDRLSFQHTAGEQTSAPNKQERS